MADVPTGPKEARFTVLSTEEEAIIVAFRKHTLLPMDDCLYALQATIPRLSRSSLHRCLQRHGISRLPDTEGDKPAKKKFKAYPVGYFHIDIAEFQTAEGKLYLYVATDRTSKFAFVQLVKKTGRTSASAFLKALIQAVPYKIHMVLTDNAIQFTFPPRYADRPTATYMTHMFDMRCRENGIQHRLTKVKHPWTNGQVGRMNRTIKEATVKRYHYDDHQQLERHLHDLIAAYNFGRRRKTLKGLIPSALTVDWSEWAGTLGEAHGLALQKPVSHQGGWYHTLRVHLQTMDSRTPKVQSQSDPANAGTEHRSRSQCSMSRHSA